MAASVLTATVTVSHQQPGWYEAVGSIAVAAGDYVTGGNTLPFNISDIKAQRLPEIVLIVGVNGNVYNFVPGTTLANGKLLIFVGAAQVAAGAMPAGVTGDTIKFRALWRGML